MSQALYRKYRSRGFDEIVGQSHVTDLLRSAVDNKSVSHAYLFTGPRGTGKTSVARILAHAVNELPYTEDSTHLDIIEIDAASNRRIDDIRDLREKVFIAPTSAKYKVYIIDEVHMLTGESFNALLKTLEEPPAHAIFILATTELHKVPATIVSRTQRFHFRPGSQTDVTAHLRAIADKESIQITDDALALIAHHSEGGFRDSLSLLDQVSSLSSDMIDTPMVESLLGLAPKDQVIAITDAIRSGHGQEAVPALQALLDTGVNASTLSQQLIRALSALAADSPELYLLIGELVDIPRSYAPHFKLLAAIGKYGAPARTAPPAAAAVAPQPVIAAPVTPPPAPPTPSAADTQKLNPAPSAAPADPASAPSAASDPLNWDEILGETQKRAPALYSIIKRAETTIDPQTITLGFAFSLHRKKLQDEKQRSQLVAIITNLYGSCPQIQITDNKPQLDTTAQTVADIMGGGEAVKI